MLHTLDTTCTPKAQMSGVQSGRPTASMLSGLINSLHAKQLPTSSSTLVLSDLGLLEELVTMPPAMSSEPRMDSRDKLSPKSSRPAKKAFSTWPHAGWIRQQVSCEAHMEAQSHDV